MIRQDFLDILRCPLDPNSRLTQEDDWLVCARCRVKYQITDGFPKLIAEEAELPPGCASLDLLPCQRDPGAPATTP